MLDTPSLARGDVRRMPGRTLDETGLGRARLLPSRRYVQHGPARPEARPTEFMVTGPGRPANGASHEPLPRNVVPGSAGDHAVEERKPLAGLCVFEARLARRIQGHHANIGPVRGSDAFGPLNGVRAARRAGQDESRIPVR